MSLNLPNSSVLGILLVVSTHSGPQLVFQYPPDLSSDPQKKSGLKRSNKSSTLEDEEDEAEIANIDDDDYIVDNTRNEELIDDEVDDNKEWDSRKMNYYLGTKKNLLLFLDEQERHRQISRERRRSHQRKNSVTPSLSGNKKSLLHDTKSITSNKNIDSTTTVDGSISDNLKKTVSRMSDSQKSVLNSTSGPSPITSTPSSTILGFEADYLCEMLCPPRQMCNSRFEIMIDDLVFLGLPIHSYESGVWRSKQMHPAKSGKLSKARTKGANDNASIDDDAMKSENTPKTQTKNILNMFHLVFIMNPPIIECNYRIDEMFHYVISRLSLVLRYEQLKHEYVWNQIRLINKLKEDFLNQTGSTSLTNYLIDKSSLCKLISECYSQISKSSIANLSINGKLRSFQIPIKTEFHSLPDSTVPYLPGSFLSSTVSMLANTGLISIGETARYDVHNLNNGALEDIDDIDDSNTDTNAEDIIYCALLLLDDPETIIRDIKAQQLSTLANFIRMIKPTESLLKLANKLKSQSGNNEFRLDVGQIKSFAFHLIYWRRARVIFPISARSVYIVSPMAPITYNFHHDIYVFKKTFPALPSLPHFLKLMSNSTKPRQFATIIPSKDHRDAYFNALSWLIRFGYVTQLHTFIWLKISRKVKMKVEVDLENEAINNKRKKASVTSDPSSNKIIAGTDNTSKVEPKQEDPANKDSQSRPSGKPIDNSTMPSDHDIDDIEKKFNFLSTGLSMVLEDDSDTIIIDPGSASTLERRWINKVISEECKLSPELTIKFYDLLKYMNGKNSLELLLLKENVSRQELRKLLFAIEDHIISVRHW